MTERLFNPEDILTQNVEANATKREPLPVGTPLAQCVELEIAEGVSGPKSKKPGTPWARLDTKWEISDPDYLKNVGDGTRDKAFAFYGIMLEMKGKQIAVGPDVNVQLGKLREACGVNGKPLNMLNGSWARLSIVQEPHYERPDEIVSKIAAVSAAE